MTFQVALQHLDQSGNFRVERKQLIHEGLLGNFRHYVNSHYHTTQIEKTVALMKDALKHSRGEHRAELVGLIDAFIVRNGTDKSVQKTLQAFDRVVRPYREGVPYAHPSNLALFKKWTAAQQPAEIFHRFPAFVQFLHDSKLLSQIKVTRDTLRIIDDEPALLVEGKWTKASEVTARFTIAESKEYSDTFLIDKGQSVYTYLDNGLGLQKCHPFLSIGGPPISTVDAADLARIQKSAASFVRPEEASLTEAARIALNEKRPFVIQVVSSYTDRGSSNLSEMLRNPRHAYLRLVAAADMPEYNIKKGDVHEFGFGWKNQEFLPFSATQGRFRSPDRWEYMPCDTRYVTNIPVDEAEASRLLDFTLRFHRRSVELGREIGFQIAKQNCSVFVAEAVKRAGVEIPIEIGLPNLVSRVAPDILVKLGRQIAAWAFSANQAIGAFIHKHTPQSVSNWTFKVTEKVRSWLHSFLEMYAAFILAPIRTILGGMSGEGGDAFKPEEGRIEGPAVKLRNLFDLKSYSYNLPKLLQDWQKEQASTVEYDKPVRLTIVPN